MAITHCTAPPESTAVAVGRVRSRLQHGLAASANECQPLMPSVARGLLEPTATVLRASRREQARPIASLASRPLARRFATLTAEVDPELTKDGQPVTGCCGRSAKGV
jgi:hypothetical protein